jgi:hypothetical protein
MHRIMFRAYQRALPAAITMRNIRATDSTGNITPHTLTFAHASLYPAIVGFECLRKSAQSRATVLPTTETS